MLAGDENFLHARCLNGDPNAWEELLKIVSPFAHKKLSRWGLTSTKEMIFFSKQFLNYWKMVTAACANLKVKANYQHGL